MDIRVRARVHVGSMFGSDPVMSALDINSFVGSGSSHESG